MCEIRLFHFTPLVNYVALTWRRYQAFPVFPSCKWRKAAWVGAWEQGYHGTEIYNWTTLTEVSYMYSMVFTNISTQSVFPASKSVLVTGWSTPFTLLLGHYCFSLQLAMCLWSSDKGSNLSHVWQKSSGSTPMFNKNVCNKMEMKYALTRDNHISCPPSIILHT